MSATLPLILREEPVTRGLLSRMKEPRPNIAVVYADAFGKTYFHDRPLKWSELVASRYRTRYEVDMNDHRRTARLDSSPLPSRGDAYFFHSMVDVGFRVTDPAAVVKRNVTDALAVVYNYLIGAFRPVTRDYDIKEAAAAEVAINSRFQQPVALDEGITIYLCRARLVPDEAAEDYLRSLTIADRSLDVDSVEHEMTVAQAQHSHQLAEQEQAGRLEAERRVLDALRPPVPLTGLIRAHLSKHPGDTDHLMTLLAAYEQARQERRGTNEQHWLDLVKYMIDKDVIQAVGVDVNVLRKQILDRTQQISSPPAGAADTAASPSAPSQQAVYDDLVRTAFAHLVKPGRILFNPPHQMQLNQTERVEVRLTRTLELDAELLQHLRGSGEPQMEEVLTAPLMAITLMGDAFQITAYSDEEQGVAQDGITTWEFDIRALKRGSQRLVMCVSLRIPVRGESFEHKSIPVREAVIDVQVRAPVLIASIIHNNWQWFIGTAIAIAAVAVAILAR